MENTSMWEILLLAAVAVLLLVLFRPGIRTALERSRQAQVRDWQGVLWPLAAVVLFVLLLMLLV